MTRRRYLAALAAVIGGARESSADTAARVFAAVGGPDGLNGATTAELLAVRGVGIATAARILAAVDLGRCVASCASERETLTSSAAAAAYAQNLIGYAEQENFVALVLDAQNRVVSDFLVARGTLTSCPVHPREVFRPLVRAGAAAVIVAHNHPSGCAEPSAQDLALTKRLVRCGDLMGIRVLDHVIVARGSHISLAERGEV